MSVVGRIKASYRRGFAARGDTVETIKIRRFTGTGPNRPMFEVSCPAVVTGFDAEELVGGIQQADRHVILMHDDLLNVGFALPITNSDFVVRKGRQYAIRVPDDASRAGVAYELQIVG